MLWAEVYNNNNNNSSNNWIYIAPYSHNFRGAGGRSDQCSVKAWVNNKVLKSRFKNRQRVADQNCLWQRVPGRSCWKSGKLAWKSLSWWMAGPSAGWQMNVKSSAADPFRDSIMQVNRNDMLRTLYVRTGNCDGYWWWGWVSNTQLIRNADSKSLWLVRVELQTILQVPLSDVSGTRGKNRQLQRVVVTHGEMELFL